MNYAQIDDNGIYQGLVPGIAGDIHDSWYSPVGVRVSSLGNPPTDEPGAWRDDGAVWVAVVPLNLEEVRAAKIGQIDAETSAAILAGFEYEVEEDSLHFSYDAHDQQNFADTANAATLALMQVPGIPESVTWNGWDITQDGEGKEVARALVRLTFSPNEFLGFYVAGALAHKAVQMETGGLRKAAAENATTVAALEAV